jgi:Ca2+-binding EF-hand superfamily protein
MKTPKLPFLAGMIFATSAVWAGEHAEKADKLDTDNDGKVSRSEYNACAERMFSTADTDQDGSLTPAELDAAVKAAPHNDQKRDDMGRSQWLGKDKFQKCDTDGDGRISTAEANAARDKLFAKLDADDDGSISMAELEAGHKAKKEKHD